MSAKDDGGSVFPCQPHNDKGAITQESGMFLRDFFAAAALQGLTTGYPWESAVGTEQEARTIRRAWRLADAMLKERQK